MIILVTISPKVLYIIAVLCFSIFPSIETTIASSVLDTLIKLCNAVFASVAVLSAFTRSLNLDVFIVSEVNV